MIESVRNPEVAVNQVRRGRLRYQSHAVSYVVLDVGDTAAIIRQDGHESTSCIALEDLRRWPCIGVGTPAGRVMVGERREAPSGVHTVLAVASPDGPYDIAWAHTVCDRDGESHMPADLVASWPLRPALAPDPAPHLPSADPLCAPSPAAARIVSQAVAEAREQRRRGGRCFRCGGTPCRLSIMGGGCESGPGIARLAIPEPTVRPDVVYTWEAWALP